MRGSTAETDGVFWNFGGPIVGSALVVLGGFYLVPNPLPFAVTVFVHGEGGIHDLLPKDSGEVVMELGGKVQASKSGQTERQILRISRRVIEVKPHNCGLSRTSLNRFTQNKSMCSRATTFKWR
jgi:hypothetical protein